MAHAILIEPWTRPREFRFIYGACTSLFDKISVISSKDPPPYLGRSWTWLKCNIHEFEELEAAFKDAEAIERSDAIVCWEDSGVVPCAHLCEKYGRFGTNLRTATLTKSKVASKEYLRAAGISCPLALPVVSEHQFEKLAGALGLPFILKPDAASGSLSISRIENAAQFAECLAEGRTNCIPSNPDGFRVGHSDYCAEQYVPGRLVSANGLVDKHQKVLFCQIIDHDSHEPFFLDRYHCIPSTLDAEALLDARGHVDSIVKALDLQATAFQIEFIFNSGKLYPIDLALRPGADYLVTDLIPRYDGFDYLGQYLRVRCGWEVSTYSASPLGDDLHIGALFLATPKKGRLKQIRGADVIAALEGVDVVTLEREVGQFIDQPPTDYDACRFLSTIISAPSREALDRIAVNIETTCEADVDHIVI